MARVLVILCCFVWWWDMVHLAICFLYRDGLSILGMGCMVTIPKSSVFVDRQHRVAIKKYHNRSEKIIKYIITCFLQIKRDMFLRTNYMILPAFTFDYFINQLVYLYIGYRWYGYTHNQMAWSSAFMVWCSHGQVPHGQVLSWSSACHQLARYHGSIGWYGLMRLIQLT